MLVVVAMLSACSTVITNPTESLRDEAKSQRIHADSLQMIMASATPLDQDTIDALQGLVYRSGYDEELRLEGMRYLLRVDRGRLLRTLRQRLPRTTDHDWLRSLCHFVAQYDMVELDAALVSSWGRPWSGSLPETQRPEFLALERMHGPGGSVIVVWETFLGAVKPSENGLRFRCWDLLHRLGARDELIELVQGEDASRSEHPTLHGVHQAAVDFGTIPWNREELLWVHKLTEPSRRGFWLEAQRATSQLTLQRRRNLELRDLPVVVAAAKHQPDLLTQTDAQLMQSVAGRLQGRRHYKERDGGFLPGEDPPHDLRSHADALTWGDLAAIAIAMDAMHLPSVRHHLFDYANRDRLDDTTEYGGIVALDEQGRFEILEFPPRFRVHDLRFEASQAMFDAGYTALFHFHNHAQKHRNKAHAGPGLGDMKYADATRANCLVLTYVNDHTINVDYYRHDGLLIDLGLVYQPGMEPDQS